MVGKFVLLFLFVLPVVCSQCESSLRGREFVFGIIQTTPNEYFHRNTRSNDTVELHITNTAPYTTRVHLQIPYLSIDTFYHVRPDQSETIPVSSDIQKMGAFHEKRGVRITTDNDINVLVTSIKPKSRAVFIESYYVLPTRSLGKRYAVSDIHSYYYYYSTALITSLVDNNQVTIYNSSGAMNSTFLDKNDVYQLEGWKDYLIVSHYDISVIAGKDNHLYYYDQRMSATYSVTPTKYWSQRYIVPRLPAYRTTARVKSDYVYLSVNVSTFSQSRLSVEKRMNDSMNSTVVLTAEKPFSVIQESVLFENSDRFVDNVPGVDQYVNDYHFTVPSFTVNATDLQLTNKVAVIVPNVDKDRLLVDGTPVSYIGNSIREFPIPAPFNNYTILSIPISEGHHRVRHLDSDVTFGLLVYGYGSGYLHGFSYDTTDYPLPYNTSYGFYAGFNFEGARCEQTVAQATTPSNPFSEFPTTSSVHIPDQSHVTMCYNCEDLGDANLCDSVKPCLGNEVCFIERQEKSGRVIYRSGCLSTDLCQSQHQYSLSRPDVCVECCNGSFCNNKGCGGTGILPREHRGPLCYDCQHVSSPQQCSGVFLCSTHQVCRIEKFTWGDSYHYKMGCANSLCDPLPRSIHHMTKRATPECHTCCNDDFCNNNCTRGNYGNSGSAIVG